MIDTHPKFDFSLSSKMIHARDVINKYINKSIQKTFARPHFKLVQKCSILIINLISSCQNTGVQGIQIHRSL